MLTRTEGIVLKTKEYTEADLIVTYLTPSKGIVNTFAKSPRKTKSRFGSSLEPLTHAKISLWGKEQSMPKITQSDILNSFHEIRENLQDFAKTSKLVEILISLIPAGIPNKNFFLFFLNIMGTLKSCAQKQKDALYLISQIRLLAVLGYAPQLTGCGRCNAKSLDFYADSGTTLCKKCAATQLGTNKIPIKITVRTVNFYSHCINSPPHYLNHHS
ncbi:MAG: DNA repair protein RecO, partial [Candidatus Mariimomonas ferrooxydans]